MILGGLCRFCIKLQCQQEPCLSQDKNHLWLVWSQVLAMEWCSSSWFQENRKVQEEPTSPEQSKACSAVCRVGRWCRWWGITVQPSVSWPSPAPATLCNDVCQLVLPVAAPPQCGYNGEQGGSETTSTGRGPPSCCLMSPSPEVCRLQHSHAQHSGVHNKLKVQFLKFILL